MDIDAYVKDLFMNQRSRPITPIADWSGTDAPTADPAPIPRNGPHNPNATVLCGGARAGGKTLARDIATHLLPDSRRHDSGALQMSWQLSEYDGSFIAFRTGGMYADQDCDGESLGRGSADQTHRFATESERSMWIQIQEMTRTINRLAGEISFLKTVKGANLNLRVVRAANRAERSK